MLRDATSIEDVKWPLNSSVRTSLDDPAIFAAKKQQVIDAWTNWENGQIFNDPFIQEKFSTFFEEPITSSSQLITILEGSDEWFDIMFRYSNL